MGRVITKESQLAHTRRGKPRRSSSYVDAPEACLQAFVDDLLNTMGYRYIRIPDGFWRFIHAAANPGILRWMRACFGGIADNTVFIPISDKYSLCLHLELKTKSELHGRQKIEAKALPWQIARTPEQVQKIMADYISEAEAIKKWLSQRTTLLSSKSDATTQTK